MPAEQWAPVGEDQDDDHLLNVCVTEFMGWGLGGDGGTKENNTDDGMGKSGNGVGRHVRACLYVCVYHTHMCM